MIVESEILTIEDYCEWHNVPLRYITPQIAEDFFYENRYLWSKKSSLEILIGLIKKKYANFELNE